MASSDANAANLFARLFSYYRHSFPAAVARYLPLYFVGGYEKRFGLGRVVCTHCHFVTDCRIHPDQADITHYAESPSCQVRRLDGGPLDAILMKLQSEFALSTFSSQLLFEDEYLRLCSLDPDFRLLTFAYGQWRHRSSVPISEFAHQGFYYSIKKGDVKCVGCLRTVDNPRTLRDLLGWHLRNSPRCRFVVLAQSEQWEPLQFSHDTSGSIIIHGEIEVTAVTPAPHTTPSGGRASSALMTTEYQPRPILKARRSLGGLAKRPLNTGSLIGLIEALNSVGISDGEIKQAVLQKPALLQLTTSAAFLQELARPTIPVAQNSIQSETDLRAGRMATVTDSRCPLCEATEKNAAFIPCRHVYACFACACRIRDAADPLERRCCLCRQDVQSVIDLRLTSVVTYY